MSIGKEFLDTYSGYEINHNLNFISKLNNKYNNLVIGDIGDFITLQIRNKENSLLFKIPKKPLPNTDIYNNHIERTKFDNLEKKYKEEFFPILTKNMKEEMYYISNKFKDTSFYIKERIKTSSSIKDKINDRMKNNENTFIHDRYGYRYIILSVDGCKDEEILKRKCFEIQNAVLEFANTDNEFAIMNNEKDFINNPTKTGYQSIHIVKKHNKTEELLDECQIRTTRMEDDCKHHPIISHRNYKKNSCISQFSEQYVPEYKLYIPSFTDKEPLTRSLSMEEAFSNRFGISYSQYRKELELLENPIKDIEKEFYGEILTFETNKEPIIR